MNIEDLRSFRIFGYAVFDFVVSYIGIIILSPLLVKLFGIIKIKTSKIQWVLLTLPIGVIFHLIFRQNTPFNQVVFSTNSGFIEKFLVLGSIFLAIFKAKKKD